jgi:hypothetical protein
VHLLGYVTTEVTSSEFRVQAQNENSHIRKEGFELSNEVMWHAWRKGEVCTRFLWGNLRERDQWGDQDVGGMIILRWIFRKWDWMELVRIGAGGGRL